MTQPVGDFGVPIAPGQQAGAFGIPVQAPPPQPAPVQQASFEQESSEREQAAAADEARRLALENEYGATETVAGKFAQGALDALLAPGALAGAYAESMGELLHVDALRDFGRGLGEASSGKSALSAMGGLAQAALEGSAIKGADFMTTAEKRLAESEEARPMLATISRMAGMSAGAIGVGLGAAGESGSAATILANAGEGAAGGAQAAYEHAAPLRDVLSSAAVGGILGGGIAGAGEAIAAGVKRVPDLAKVFGEKAQEFADSRMVKGTVGRDSKFWKLMGGDPERVARIAERLRGADVLGKSDDAMLEALNIETSKAGENLGQIAKRLDDAGIVPSVENLTESIDSQLAALRKSGSGTEQTIADSIEREVAPFKNKLAVKQTDQFGNEMVAGYRNPTFTELREFKQALGRAKKAHFTSNSLAAEETSHLNGSVAESLNEAADNAGPAVSRLWKESNQSYSDLINVSDAIEREAIRKQKNRFISPSDYAVGLTTAIMHGNPIAGMAAALGHHVLREGGSHVISSLANRFARMSSHVSLMKAGGPEAQAILESIGRTKNFMEETAARAGANPTLQQGARDTAKQVAASELERKAGKFDPARWLDKPLNPLQKVLYRTQVLNTVSTDLSKAAEQIAALHPAMPDALDPRRLARLTRDANGAEAIGALQSLVGESAKAAPGTATGDAVGAELRKLGMKLTTADPAQAMAESHAIAGRLREAAEYAPDELSKAYALRSEQALRGALSSSDWGSAGEAYAKLAAPPPADLVAMADPKQLREAIRSGGHDLASRIETAQNAIAATHDAAFKLAGTERPEGFGKMLAQGRKVFEAGQDAVTVDGKPMASIFDAAGSAGVYGANSQQQVTESTVQDHVEKGLDKLTPMLHGDTKRAAQLAGTETAAPMASREEYDKRMKILTHAVSQPDVAMQGHQIYAGVSPFVGEKMAQLMADMPKPTHSVQGKVFETLSRDDLRLANAMWEATTEPLSVLSDLAAGTLDPDKASYAWKQYPGLQRAAQAGVMDDLMRLTDDQRSDVPGTVLTQVDRALGFQGALQDANDPAFAERMSKLYQPAPAKPQPGGTLATPAAEPTYTQRLSGQS